MQNVTGSLWFWRLQKEFPSRVPISLSHFSSHSLHHQTFKNGALNESFSFSYVVGFFITYHFYTYMHENMFLFVSFNGLELSKIHYFHSTFPFFSKCSLWILLILSILSSVKITGYTILMKTYNGKLQDFNNVKTSKKWTKNSQSKNIEAGAYKRTITR